PAGPRPAAAGAHLPPLFDEIGNQVLGHEACGPGDERKPCHAGGIIGEEPASPRRVSFPANARDFLLACASSSADAASRREVCAGAWAGELGRSGCLPTAAHAAPIPAAPQAMCAGRVVGEDVLAMLSAERFYTVGLARSPRNPQDRRPSIGSLVLPGHACTPFLAPLVQTVQAVPTVQTLEGRPRSPRREDLRPYGSSSPGSPLHCRLGATAGHRQSKQPAEAATPAEGERECQTRFERTASPPRPGGKLNLFHDVPMRLVQHGTT
ncbi:MAG: hypothetical protein JWL57_1195, partial [Actinobacteria bacterium]|nr:hypothetical protein [Actinomycetota bacterium]